MGGNFLITICDGIGAGPCGGRSRRISGGGFGRGAAR
jgi:hypothetical protein